METVRAGLTAQHRVSTWVLCPRGTRAANGGAVGSRMEFSVLDLAYVLGVLAVFALVGVIARGVEKL